MPEWLVGLRVGTLAAAMVPSALAVPPGHAQSVQGDPPSFCEQRTESTIQRPIYLCFYSSGATLAWLDEGSPAARPLLFVILPGPDAAVTPIGQDFFGSSITAPLLEPVRLGDYSQGLWWLGTRTDATLAWVRLMVRNRDDTCQDAGRFTGRTVFLRRIALADESPPMPVYLVLPDGTVCDIDRAVLPPGA
jgi:hypothetical protein